MTPSNGTRAGAVAVAALLALAAPAGAFAAKRHHHHRVSAPQPIVNVPHKYDAGGDGGEPTTPPGVSVQLFDPVAVAQGLGNPVLGQLGLPPLPTV